MPVAGLDDIQINYTEECIYVILVLYLEVPQFVLLVLPLYQLSLIETTTLGTTLPLLIQLSLQVLLSRC